MLGGDLISSKKLLHPTNINYINNGSVSCTLFDSILILHHVDTIST
jgi:hypothetical protein